MEAKTVYQTGKARLYELYFKVLNGEKEALDAYSYVKQLKSIYDELLPQFEALALEEATKYDQKTFRKSGFEYQLRNGGRRFSYSHIPKWIEVKEQLKKVEAQHKQAFISKQKGMLIANQDGEEIILPKVSYNKDSLTVKQIE